MQIAFSGAFFCNNIPIYLSDYSVFVKLSHLLFILLNTIILIGKT